MSEDQPEASDESADTASDGDADTPAGAAETASEDQQSRTFLEETFETTEHEPETPTFDVTSGEDLVDRLPTGSDAPADVQKSFWGMVVLLKIALLALSLGAMLAYFRGQVAIAAGLLLVGGVAAVRLWLRVRAFGED